MTLLTEEELEEFIDDHYHDGGDELFRMEQLPFFDVQHQAAELEAWRAGRDPDWSQLNSWLDVLAQERQRGLLSRRVRVLSAGLTDDEQRACNWGYPYTGKYEDIRVLRHGEHRFPPHLLGEDYWIVSNTYVVAMHYTPTGAFEAAELLPNRDLPRYMSDQQSAWAAAEPFGQWWSRHRELHRQLAA